MCAQATWLTVHASTAHSSAKPYIWLSLTYLESLDELAVTCNCTLLPSQQSQHTGTSSWMTLGQAFMKWQWEEVPVVSCATPPKWKQEAGASLG